MFNETSKKRIGIDKKRGNILKITWINTLWIFKILISVFVFHRVVHARNNIQVVPHYPSTAYITERLLPFSIVGEKADEKIRVQSIDLIKGQSCHTMIDPFYEKIFHVYCLKPAGVRVI